MSAIAVEVKNVSKKFGKKEVFSGLNLQIASGRVVGLLGENAIGKTTLLKMIADILKPHAGEITVAGQKISRHTRQLVSFMVSPGNFFGFMNVRDAVNYYRDFYPDFDHARAVQLCEEFGLAPKERISLMSSGQQERLCILLCLCRRVPLYLLDEPIAGLDPKFKHESIKTMLQQAGEEQTLIISSHLLRDLDSVFDEIVILKKNGVVQAMCDDIRAAGESVEAFYLRMAAEDAPTGGEAAQ